MLRKIFGFCLILSILFVVTGCNENSKANSLTAVPTSSPTNSPAILPTTKPKTEDIQSIGMNLTQIQTGNYSSLQGTWTEVAYAVNALDGNGEQWKTGALAPDTLFVSSDKIAFKGTTAVIQGNTLTDSAGSHHLSFKNNGSSLDTSLADADVVAINYAVYFYPKGVTNDIQPNNGVKIDNTKNLIVIWSSNNGYTAVFART